MPREPKYGLFVWHADPRYQRQDALALYVSSKVAQREADKRNARGENVVVRELKYTRNPRKALRAARPGKKFFLVYQAGIANVFQVKAFNLADYGRDAKRVYQGDFRTAEAIARGLAIAGATVRTAASNRAGDIAHETWTEDLDSQPFSEQFRPVRANPHRSSGPPSHIRMVIRKRKRFARAAAPAGVKRSRGNKVTRYRKNPLVTFGANPMSKKHYEFMADWIARNARNVEEQRLLVAFSLAVIAHDGNPRFERARFENRIGDLMEKYGPSKGRFTNPRPNPNGHGRHVATFGKVVEVGYRRTVEPDKGKLFKHEFEVPMNLTALSDGTLAVWHPTIPAWGRE